MKTSHSIFIVLFFTIQSFFTISQDLTIDNQREMNEYIGSINHEFYFVSHPLGDYYNSRVFSIYNNNITNDKIFEGHFPGNTTSTQKEKNDLAKQHFKWFIIDSNVYSIYKLTNVGYARLTIYKYDKQLNAIDSFPLLIDETTKNNDFEPIIHISNKRIGLVSPLDRKNSTYVFATYDLENDENFTSYFTLNKIADYSCTDFTFNSKNNFFMLLEAPENFMNETLSHKLNPALVNCQLVSFIDDEVQMKEISSSSSNEYFRSFKFHKISEDSLVLCGLVYESTKGLYFNGYRFSYLEFNTGKESIEKFIPLQKVKNDELLSQKDIKSTVSVNHYNSPYQHLKEIIRLNNGNFMFISEGHNLENINSLSATNNTTGPLPTLSFFETKRNFFYCSNDDIFVSCYNQSSGLMWTTKTIQRFENLTMKFGSVNNDKTYYSDLLVDANKLNIYFPTYPGLLQKPINYNTNNQKPSVAKFSIDLSNGTATLKEIDKKISQKQTECLVVSAICPKNNQELYFWIQSKNPLAKCNYRLYTLNR